MLTVTISLCGCVILDFSSTSQLPCYCARMWYQPILMPRSKIPHFLFLFFVWYGLFFSSYLPTTPCLCNWGAWGRIFLKSDKLIRGQLVCFLFLNFDKLLSITAGCSWLNPLSSDGFVSGFLLSFHVIDMICTKHIIDRIVQIGNDQILHVAKGIEFHFGFTYGKEERKKGKRKFSHLQKRGCVIPEVIAFAKEWGWLWDLIMMIIFQFVELSTVSFSLSNSASQKESPLQRKRVPLPEKSLVKHPELLFSLYPARH